jgi:hypothetical protein
MSAATRVTGQLEWGPWWRAQGMHWHGYQRPGLGLPDPQAHRMVRLVAGPGELLETPVSAALWLNDRVHDLGGMVSVWDTDRDRWRELCPATWSVAVRSTVISYTAQGQEFYAVSRSALGNHTFFLEGALDYACPSPRCQHHYRPRTVETVAVKEEML